jgi:hypothetical protein
VRFLFLWLYISNKATKYCYNSLRSEVIPFREESGHGPMANTVLDPAAICVLPASITT